MEAFENNLLNDFLENSKQFIKEFCKKYSTIIKYFISLFCNNTQITSEIQNDSQQDKFKLLTNDCKIIKNFHSNAESSFQLMIL